MRMLFLNVWIWTFKSTPGYRREDTTSTKTPENQQRAEKRAFKIGLNWAGLTGLDRDHAGEK